MNAFTDLYLGPADSPAPWKLALKPATKLRRTWTGKMKTTHDTLYIIEDAEGMFVAEANSKLVGDAIVIAVNSRAAESI